MHRHGYKGRKFGRETGERRALIRSLERALIQEQSITTTLARAKEIRRSSEKLITLAKKGGLANRRLIIARLDDADTAALLMDIIAPQIQRDSGYLRIENAGFRRGDHAEMGTISFVDDIDLEKTPVSATAKAAQPAQKSSAGSAKPSAEQPAKAAKPAAAPKASAEADKEAK